eukprot:2441581-Heterocapsa_arctica.AAC.1
MHRGMHRGMHCNNSPPILYSFLRLSFSEDNAVATYTWLQCVFTSLLCPPVMEPAQQLPCTSGCLAQELHYMLYF